MDQLVTLVWNQFGGGWLAVIVILGAILHFTGAIPAFVQARQATQERESEENTSFVESLVAENRDLRASLDLQMRGRQEDLERWRKIWQEQSEEVARLRTAGEKKDEAIANLARGESQWRHLYRGALSSIMALRVVLERAEIDFPPFEGWRSLQELDPKLYIEMEALFTPKPPPRSE